MRAAVRVVHPWRCGIDDEDVDGAELLVPPCGSAQACRDTRPARTGKCHDLPPSYAARLDDRDGAVGV
jgi:hypothetical protein